MVSRLDRFKKEMEPSKELYTREITNFAKRYDVLGKMNLIEERTLIPRNTSIPLRR